MKHNCLGVDETAASEGGYIQWSSLRVMDLSYNSITSIDTSLVRGWERGRERGRGREREGEREGERGREGEGEREGERGGREGGRGGRGKERESASTCIW